MPLLVQVSLHYRPIEGGQEVYIANLSHVLSAAGWETKVIQPYRGETAPDTATVPRIPGIPRYLPFFEEFQFAFFAASGRANLLNRATVILCHYATTAALISRVPRWRRKSIVLSHGVEWNVDRMNRHDRVREWNAKRLFDKTVFVANDTDYLRRFGLDVKPGTKYFHEISPGKWFIPNCINIDIFKRCNPVPEFAGKKNILVPRQITEDRGIDLAIRAFALFAERKKGYYLRIIGKVPDRQYLKKCKYIVKELGLQDTVTFHAAVTNWKMPEYYSSAELTLIPSLCREGTSLSALESMACGTPTVSSNIGGLQDLPTVQESADEKSFADAMLATVENSKSISTKQRDFVRSTFNMHNWSRAWLAVVDSVLTSSTDGL